MHDSGVYKLFSTVSQLEVSAWGSVLEWKPLWRICILLKQSRTHFHTLQNRSSGDWANAQETQVCENEETPVGQGNILKITHALRKAWALILPKKWLRQIVQGISLKENIHCVSPWGWGTGNFINSVIGISSGEAAPHVCHVGNALHPLEASWGHLPRSTRSVTHWSWKVQCDLCPPMAWLLCPPCSRTTPFSGAVSQGAWLCPKALPAVWHLALGVRLSPEPHSQSPAPLSLPAE